ncbi:MAG: hypothetical protein EXQ55_01285 [Acidobacteria bacterium]|nr:hypothetical protein [Acidobacteriota bacterium]
MSRGLHLLLLAVCLAGAATFSITAWRLIDSPLRFDEVDFAEQADGILRHGVPKILYSQTRHIATPVERGQDVDTRYGMWHPPLYLYSLAACLKAFGHGNWAVRAAGLGWFLITTAVVWWTVSRRRPPDRLFGTLAIAMALLSPLVAQGIFFLDIDNTSLSAALILFTAAFASAPGDHSLRRTMTLAALLLWRCGRS